MKQYFYAILIIIFLYLQVFSQQEINESKPAKINNKVIITNTAGKVSITGWENEEVSVKGTIGKYIKELKFTSNGNIIIIEAVILNKFLNKGKNIECFLNIKVPNKSNFTINSISSDVDISDITGNAKIKTVSGDINNNGDLQIVDIETVSGDIKINGNLKELDINTISGDIDITGISEYLETGIISGDIDINGSFSNIKIKSVSGDINLKNDALNNGTFITTSGNIVLECNPLNNARLEVQSTSGDIQLIISEELNAQFELETFSGNINIKGISNENQDTSLDNIEMEGNNKKIKFINGSRDTRISLETFSGNILIKIGLNK